MNAAHAPQPPELPRGAMLDLELSEAFPAVSPERIGASPDGCIRVLARLHGRPLGQLELAPPRDSGLSPDALAAAMQVLLPAANRHLRADDLPAVATIDAAGLGRPDGMPTCEASRRSALRDAPLVSALIATRDRPDSLRRCLESLGRVDYPAFEVVVVDSAPSDDRSAEVVAALEGRLGPARLRYIREHRPGLAVAHNTGLAMARGSWVAITDDDVVVEPAWLAALIEAASASSTVACVTGLILPAELETRAQVLLEQYGGFARGFTTRHFDLGANRPPDPLFPWTAGRLGSGANMAFRTSVLRQLGGFDPALGAGTPARGGDDLVSFVRVLRAGYTLVYEPSAVVWHHHRRDYAGLVRQSRHYGVGLGAYLTSAVAREPGLVPTVLAQALPAWRHMISRRSAKNANKPKDFPRVLEWAERLGLLYGPPAYAVSRLRGWTGR